MRLKEDKLNDMLTIIIVNFFSEKLIKNCVDSIRNHAEIENTTIIVVDNGSNTFILNELEEENVIKLIKTEENKGFGAACNLGAKEAKSKYLLFLNPDTRVYKHSIQHSLEFLENNRNVTVLGVKQTDENNNTHRSCARFVTLKRYSNTLFRLNKVSNKRFKGYHMSDWDHGSSCFVDHVIGAFYMIKTKDFRKILGFDEDYFVYYEDLDLSKRILDSGGKIYYNAEIEIFHQGGGTSQNFKAQRLFYSLDALLTYGSKHLGTVNYIVLIFLVFIIEPMLRLIEGVFTGDKNKIIEIIKAFKMLYKKRLLK